MAVTAIDLDEIINSSFTEEQQQKLIAIQSLRKAIGKQPGDENFDFKLACLADMCNVVGGLSRYYAGQNTDMDKKMAVALLLCFNIIQALGRQYAIDNNINVN